MRAYPINSAQAAARVVALSLLADGHLGAREFEALRASDLARRLSLDEQAVRAVVHQLAEDLLSTGGSAWNGASGADEGLVAGALSEIVDEDLRREVLALCKAVAQADGHLSEGEQALLAAAARRWALPACAT